MGRFYFLILGVFLLISSFKSSYSAQYRGGALPTPPEIAEKYKISSLAITKAAPKALPPIIDLCNQLPPVDSQGRQGSCVGWAVGYYYKTFLEGKERGWDLSDKAHICSPAFVYNQINGGQDDGSFIVDGLKLLTRQGCTSWEDMPYNENDYTTLPTTSQMLNALNWRSLDFGFLATYNSKNCIIDATNDNNDICKRSVPLTDSDITAMKTILANGNIIVIGIPVFDNFYTTGEIYSGPTTDSVYKGGHAIVICGYDDTKGGFKVRNSWGTDWGVNGEAYLTYDFIKNYVWDVAFMNDRINYEWKIISKVKIDNLYRGDLSLEFENAEDGAKFLFTGDYLYQNVWKDTRTYPSEIPIDLTDLGIPLEYNLNIKDLNKADTNNTNTGYISYVSVETNLVSLPFESEILPYAIPTDLGILNIHGLGLRINNFSVNPVEINVNEYAIFNYDVSSYLPTKCSFDLNNDGSIEVTIPSCQGSGSFSYTYTEVGTFFPELTADNLVVTAKETTTITINDVYIDDGGGSDGDDYTDIEDPGGGKKCSVSQVSEGTILENHLQPLRDFRDKFLAKFSLGKWFIKKYYEFSAKYADDLNANPVTKYLLVTTLLPIALSIEYYYIVLPLLALGLVLVFFRITIQRN